MADARVATKQPGPLKIGRARRLQATGIGRAYVGHLRGERRFSAGRPAGGAVTQGKQRKQTRGGKPLRGAVYTVLVGGFDALLSPVQFEPELDYFAFTDGEQVIPKPWQSKPLASRQRNPRMTARWHKLHPHRLLADYEESLYVDANVLIKDRIVPLFARALREAPLALFRHPDRDCVYEEAETVKRLRYDDSAIVDAQMAFYRAHGLAPRAGLHFGGIQFRRHNDPKLIPLLEDWWRELKIFSHRDQLSLSFMVQRHRVTIENLPGLVTDNSWFMIGPHRRFRVDLAGLLPPVDADAVDWLRTSFIGASRRSSPEPRPCLTAAGESILRIGKTPWTLGKRIVRRLGWWRYLARNYRVRPRAK